MDEQDRLPEAPLPEAPTDGGGAGRFVWPQGPLIVGFALLLFAATCGVVIASRGDPTEPGISPSVGGITVTPSQDSPTPASDASQSPSDEQADPEEEPSPGQDGGEELPDLLVSGLTGTSVVVVNAGEGAAGAFTVVVSGTSFALGGLEPGASIARSFPCREGPLTASVDPADQVREANELNNSRTGGPFVCDQDELPPLPDLVVRSLRSTGVTVANRGDAEAGSFSVTVSGASLSFAGLQAGASTSAKFPCREGDLTATVDPTGRVEESDETNNSLTAGPFTCPRPDLVVAALTRDSVTVRNQGTARAARSSVSVTGVGSLPVSALDAGASSTVSFPCTEGTLTARADASNAVAESVETNNTRTAGPFTCPLPDLVVVEVRSDQATVRNQGDAEAGPFVVTVSGVGNFNLGALAPGATRVVSYLCQEGSITVTADPSDQIDESNENNNSLTANRLTCPRPDLVISDLTTNQVTVTNQGTAAAGPFVVTVTGPGAFQVGGLAAGQSLVIDLGGCFAGTRTATADAQGQVAESNENNNSLTRDTGIC